MPISAVPAMPPTMRSDCSIAVAMPSCAARGLLREHGQVGHDEAQAEAAHQHQRQQQVPRHVASRLRQARQASASMIKPAYSMAFGLRTRVMIRPFRILPTVMQTTSGVTSRPASFGE